MIANVRSMIGVLAAFRSQLRRKKRYGGLAKDQRKRRLRQLAQHRMLLEDSGRSLRSAGQFDLDGAISAEAFETAINASRTSL